MLPFQGDGVRGLLLPKAVAVGPGYNALSGREMGCCGDMAGIIAGDKVNKVRFGGRWVVIKVWEKGE